MGNPIRERQKREAEIAATNWTKLADEWLKERARAAENFDVALLPFNNRFRKLPPTADNIVINETNPDRLARSVIR
ncbi:sphingomyelin phosphodiesterase-like isoform X1 [Vespula squamosa]|uniref:Sphingomyelin phosphodiesterase-like isoform X1 n=1 Tax=Vespula squamosa TaxID=30214 RepID=A0ABD2A956_VESSQ